MDRSQLHTLLPHRGPALWLDALLAHDPLRIEGLSAWQYLARLGEDASPCLLFEAAAQLCAAHGALYGEDSAIDMALVGKLSQLQLHSDRRRSAGPLRVGAEQQALGPAGALYAFDVHDGAELLLDGKLLLVLIRA